MSDNKQIDRIKLGLFVREEDDCIVILRPHENDGKAPGYKYEILQVLGKNRNEYFNEHTGKYYKWVYGVVGLPFEMWYNKVKTGFYKMGDY